MSKADPQFSALQRAIDSVGGQSAMGRLLGISQAAVWGWLKRGTPLPAEHAAKVEKATSISRHQLRPDIFGPAPAVIDSLPRLSDAGAADDMEPAK